MRLALLLMIMSISFCHASNDSDTSIIKRHLTVLTKTQKYRNYHNIDQLNKTADYIRSVFRLYTDNVFIQEYTVNNQVYKNIICSFNISAKKRIVVGAHYDVCNEQEGADDNASGVVGLLELARQLKGKKLNHRIDLVAYTLEEPPYFRTEFMGSYIHAKSLISRKADVLGMVSLEMIGYFKDKSKSQDYPIGLLSMFYGDKGDYITIVKKIAAGKFANQFNHIFRSARTIKTKTFTGPKSLSGIDFSDHLNYWKFGFSALMITDTSFYRNKNYHQKTDQMDTLDLNRMAKVIDAVRITLLKL
ncbi:M28 family peptidase [Pedobacter punctiformis]|uniref:M28 family peptidase n=1 Tax=Pedobacter punctiformis TaxID=3004097 RepID=A0ABT4L9A4_9SPHI|nr:M28 family peptidase [Pedobacter sp. HCMS5-2]MCZ4244478.1 M28 family peptidase [Pedobacter sp. HCMS5-2]